MPSALELLRAGRSEELWLKSCGFIDLSIEQFMTIQRRLLLEQLELLKRCDLGAAVMRGAKPGSVDEFREQVPLTTYADYEPYLPERMEDALPVRPLLWQRTSGRSSGHSFKWVPVTERVYWELGDVFLALLLFASCKGRGDVVLEEGDKFLYGLAPPPYASGCWGRRANEEGIFKFLPPIDEAEQMAFQDRIEEGFKMGMAGGINVMAAISSMLVAIGNRFAEGGGLSRLPAMLRKPELLPRLAKGVVKSKLARRPMLPRDLWTLKGLVSTGTDSVVYRERIKEMWGRYPLDIYGATESVIVAMQTWDYGAMSFVPNLNFLEFMPESEYPKWSQDRSYRARTLLLDEVIPFERYVVVITNFLGGAFTRYVLGDIVEITSLRNHNLNIDIPQMEFYSRADDVIDFTYASFTEKTIWQAIEGTGIRYVDWVARKEIGETPVLHLYVELAASALRGQEEVRRAVDGQFKAASDEYAHLEGEFGMNLLKVTLLPGGAFEGYMADRQAAGADLAHLKPPRVNPSDEALRILLKSDAVDPVAVRI